MTFWISPDFGTIRFGDRLGDLTDHRPDRLGRFLGHTLNPLLTASELTLFRLVVVSPKGPLKQAHFVGREMCLFWRPECIVSLAVPP